MTPTAGLISELGPPPERDRAAAFVAARRNSRRVVRLKAAILAGSCLAVASLVLVWLYDPFSRIPTGVSIAGASLSGSKITMEHPKLTGFRRDGRPYQLLASSGVQDVKHPTIVELNDIEAEVSMPDKSVLRLRSPKGVYDSVKDFMRLPSEIHVTSTSGYDARLRSAAVDFKAGALVSNQPVVVTTGASRIAADGLKISGNGEVIDFIGHVNSTVTTAPKAPRTGLAQ